MPDAPRSERAALSREYSQFLVELSIALHKFSMYPGGHPALAPATEAVIARAEPLLPGADGTIGRAMGVSSRVGRWRERRALYGAPAGPIAAAVFWAPYDRARLGALGRYVTESRRIPSWTRGEEAIALAQTAYACRSEARIVEIGTFLGASAVLLAGARRLRGSGRVLCVDPFDGSGDPYSAPVYAAIAAASPRSLRARFDAHVRRAGLEACIDVFTGTAVEAAAGWRQPVDLLVLDGDQSPEGVRAAYEAWAPFLGPGAVIALHNTGPQAFAPEHDGHQRLVTTTIRPPEYEQVRLVGTLTLARRARTGGPA